MRYFIHLAYDGAAYVGWQIQPNGRSIQEVLQHAFSLLLKEPIEITGCGRTDAGVHAKNFYAHFQTTTLISTNHCATLCFRLNAFLPEDIRLFRIFPVAEDLHARFSAQSRSYEYHVCLSKKPFQRNYTWRIGFLPDIEAMNRAAKQLCQHHDFTSFSKLHTQTKTNNCNVYNALWEWGLEDHLVFTISADRFLRNMVRAIVGTLLEVGKGKLSVEQFGQIIEQKDRCAAGISVPAHALFLSQVAYQDGFDRMGKDNATAAL